MDKSNKTALVIVGIIALVIIGGIMVYATTRTKSSPATSNDNPPSVVPPVLQIGAPSVVTNPSVVPTDTTAVVTGTVTPNGVTTSYWYEYGLTPDDLQNKTPTQVLGSGYTTIPSPAYIVGLTKDTNYYFRLVAVNSVGKNTGLQYAFITTHGIPVPSGSAPTVKTLAAGGISRMVANLNGEVTPNKVATQYWFEYGTTPNLGSTTALVSVGDGNVKIPASISLSDLLPVTTYYFRLNAQNQFGTINGAILNLKTSGPPAASAPVVVTKSANAIGTSTATLHATVNPNGAETMYWFEYSTDSFFTGSSLKNTDKKSAGAGLNNFPVDANISDLSPKSTYYFRVVAQNSFGIVRGNSVSFKTK